MTECVSGVLGTNTTVITRLDRVIHTVMAPNVGPCRLEEERSGSHGQAMG